MNTPAAREELWTFARQLGVECNLIYEGYDIGGAVATRVQLAANALHGDGAVQSTFGRINAVIGHLAASGYVFGLSMTIEDQPEHHLLNGTVLTWLGVRVTAELTLQ